MLLGLTRACLCLTGRRAPVGFKDECRDDVACTYSDETPTRLPTLYPQHCVFVPASYSWPAAAANATFKSSHAAALASSSSPRRASSPSPASSISSPSLSRASSHPRPTSLFLELRPALALRLSFSTAASSSIARDSTRPVAAMSGRFVRASKYREWPRTAPLRPVLTRVAQATSLGSPRARSFATTICTSVAMPGTPTWSRCLTLGRRNPLGPDADAEPPGQPLIPLGQLGRLGRRRLCRRPLEREGQATRPDSPVSRPHRCRPRYRLVGETPNPASRGVC